MKNILIVSLSNLSTDPRILRQVDALKSDYNIDVVGFGPKINGVRKFYELSINQHENARSIRKIKKVFLLFLRLYKRLYFYDLNLINSCIPIAKDTKYDLIIANDFNSLPLIKFSKVKEVRVLLDAHEYYFDEFYSPIRSRLFKNYKKWVAGILFDQIYAMSTVSNGIAREYERCYSLAPVYVVRNTPKLSKIEFENRTTDEIHLVHHGAAVPGRGLIELVELVSHLRDEFILNLMLVDTDRRFLDELKEKAKSLEERVVFHDPVPTEMISSKISQFDIGIFVLRPRSLNNHFVLPNKFFEYIQGNLGVITGASPEMSEVVAKNSLGIITDTFDTEEIASQINGLGRSQVEVFRKNSMHAAGSLCWENESVVLKDLVANLIETSHD